MFTALKDALPLLKIQDINLVRQIKGYRYVGLKPTKMTYDDMFISLSIALASKRTSSGSRGIIGHSQGWDD